LTVEKDKDRDDCTDQHRHSAGRERQSREQQIAELEREIDRLQRAEEEIVVATGAPREARSPEWVVLGIKAIGHPAAAVAPLCKSLRDARFALDLAHEARAFARETARGE
jgi:hypothetical protein